MIPEDLYQAVAQVLALRLPSRGNRPQEGRRPSELERAAERLMGHTDLLAALGVVLIVVMLIIPLPPVLLDFFITLNISAGHRDRRRDALPQTRARLRLVPVAAAADDDVPARAQRLGHAPDPHDRRRRPRRQAFGDFVVGGNVVVGLVIFLILIVIQFVVVTNGAGRVAEVGARFTLDAMPGKQMAIDADLNAGLITDDEARRRRTEISQRGRLLRLDGRRLEVRQRRRDGGDRDRADQPDRRHRRRHHAAWGCRSARRSTTSRC